MGLAGTGRCKERTCLIGSWRCRNFERSNGQFIAGTKTHSLACLWIVNPNGQHPVAVSRSAGRYRDLSPVADERALTSLNGQWLSKESRGTVGLCYRLTVVAQMDEDSQIFWPSLYFPLQPEIDSLTRTVDTVSDDSRHGMDGPYGKRSFGHCRAEWAEADPILCSIWHGRRDPGGWQVHQLAIRCTPENSSRLDGSTCCAHTNNRR